MGFVSKLGETIKARLNPKTIAAEMFTTVTDRIIPHGAAELSHALFTQGSGYVPYGQDSLPVAEPDAASPQTEASPEPATVAPLLSPTEQYQANLAMYGQRSSPTKDQTPSL